MKAAPDQLGACEGSQSSGSATLGKLKGRLNPSAMRLVPARRFSAALGFGREMSDRRQTTIDKRLSSGNLRAIPMPRSTSVSNFEIPLRERLPRARALDRSALDRLPFRRTLRSKSVMRGRRSERSAEAPRLLIPSEDSAS
jgi:hypothetical protein